jgi:Lysyl oxidase/WD40-like Beta Propeller Repeat
MLLALALPAVALVGGAVLAVVHATAAGAVPVAVRPALVVPVTGGLALVDAAGGPPSIVPGSEPGDADPALAPDGQRVALARRFGQDSEIVVLDLWTGEAHRLTVNRALDESPAWSPDGAQLVWASGKRGTFDLYAMKADGRGKRRIVRSTANDVDPAWSSDGRLVVFASNRDGSYDLMTVSATGGAATPIVTGPEDERRPGWSPRGDRLAYVRARGDVSDIYITDPTGTLERRVSSGSGAATRPAWSPDGLHVAFARTARGRTDPWLVRLDGANAVRVAVPFPARPDGLSFGLAAAGPEPLAGELLPDLDQRAPAGLVVSRVRGRVVLGFASAVDNVGRGPLWIKGYRESRAQPIMRADQLVETAGGAVRVYRDVGGLRYTPHPPHYHWHFQPFERYELHRASDFAFLARDRKSGFCLADHYGQAAVRVGGIAPPRFLGDCGKGQTGLRYVEQGNSVGYTDRYPAFFHGQDIDLTGIEPGLYVVVHRANPERLVHELRYDNNAASVLIRLGRPATAGGTPTLTVLRTCQTSEFCPAE